MRLTKRTALFLLLGGVLLAAAAALAVWPAAAAPDRPDGNIWAQAFPRPPALSILKSPAQPAPPAQEIGNDACLACHGTPGLSTRLPNGDVLYLTIDPAALQASAHGQQGLRCVSCHTGFTGYPHPPLTAQSRRDVTLQLYQSCRQCHNDKYELTLDSVHQRTLASGNPNAAVCTDCHNPHTQARLTDPGSRQLLPEARVQIPQTCARCHSAIYDEYKQSVHGSALIGQGNPDVPTCIDCHGVHNIEDPTTAAFRLKSPNICARCHTDPARMAKYGISTDVLNTYVADFHGTTVTLFEKQSPDQPTNKPVCFDCHGVHDISRVDDPQHGLRVRDNLLRTCQKCHPGATLNFPDAWLSHYIPGPERNSLVYYVQLFYRIFIPTVIGVMLIFVLTDLGRRLIERRKGAAQS